MLDCGCEPSLEGGYGDDGRSSRYSMDWCPTHKAAERMVTVLTALSKLDLPAHKAVDDLYALLEDHE